MSLPVNVSIVPCPLHSQSYSKIKLERHKKSPSDREELVKRVDEKNVDGYMVRYLPWEKS